MNSNDNMSFMPPDEPTAVYPIGASGKDEKPKNTPSPVLAEPPEPPQLSPEVVREARSSTSGGINPVVALTLVGFPILAGIAAVILAGLLYSMG